VVVVVVLVDARWMRDGCGVRVRARVRVRVRDGREVEVDWRA